MQRLSISENLDVQRAVALSQRSRTQLAGIAESCAVSEACSRVVSVKKPEHVVKKQ